MRRFINKLRQKPKSTRQKIALGTSASATGLIFVVWLTVLVHGGGLSPTQQTQETQTASPITTLEENAGSAFSSFKKRLQGQSGTTSAASALPARESSTNQSTSSTSSQPNDPAGVKRVDDQPYWQANDTNADNSQMEREPPRPKTESSDNFWQDDEGDINDEGGWF